MSSEGTSAAGRPVTVVTALGGSGVSVILAACRACERSRDDGTGVLVYLSGSKLPEPTIFSSAPAKETEGQLREAGFQAAARGSICLVALTAEEDWLEEILDLLENLPGHCRPVITVPPLHYSELIQCDVVNLEQVVLFNDRRPGLETGSLIDLARREASSRCGEVQVEESRPGWLAGRLARAGIPPGHPGGRLRRKLARSEGQATPMVLGAVFVLVLGAMVLVALGGAVTGKARAQRAVDLAALSAAASMKDDLPRLLAPPVLPNGLPNPAHMEKPVYLMRARLAATRIGVANGSSAVNLRVSFPDAISFAPVRARVSVRSRVKGGRLRAVESWAEARVSAPLGMGSVPDMASGGGYSGPLAERQGKGMRPDVAAAFDRMAAAAQASGLTISITSAFRSDAEQAALFAAHPDPTWVARPGTSLHRCATELDLGPSSSYEWLAANAARFGFVKRYSWEAWHFGFTAGPDPCSSAGNSIGAGSGRGEPAVASLPGFVPRQFRRAILAAAMKWNVSAALLAAQLYAESNFDPNASSTAGAQGIAQFIPSTAAAYGLRDPFDPEQAIDAQGHLMSDLLRQFGAPALALAAYNAGPGAVSGCDCVPSIPETRAYVARILGLLGGVGAIAPVPMEIELIR